MSQELREEAVVLGSVDYGESDRIVTLFTRGQGKVGAFARGARASHKRFAGALEPFTELEVRLRPGRGDLYRLDSCSIRDAFFGLRGSLEGIVFAGHAAELCRELLREREPHEGLYELLLGYLRALSAGQATQEDLLAFELQALGEAGFAPRLDACARCGAQDLGPRCPFDPAHGGVLCPRCAAQSQQGLPMLGAETLAALRALQILPVGRAAAQLPAGGFAPAARREARAVIRRTTHAILGRQPRSLELFRQLGVEG
jgi:DNA repair protein RecO (recombination protein O)